MVRSCAAVFGGRKRGPGAISSQTPSQTPAGARDVAAGSPGSPEAREEQMANLLGELRQRLRARSREVLVLVRVAAVDFVTPASVLALLDTLSSLPGPPSSLLAPRFRCGWLCCLVEHIAEGLHSCSHGGTA